MSITGSKMYNWEINEGKKKQGRHVGNLNLPLW